MLIKYYKIIIHVLACQVTFKIVDECSKTVKMQGKDSTIKLRTAL